MRELLSKKDLRRLELIETIFLNQGMTVEALTEHLSLNKVQVQTDIGFLGPILSPLRMTISKEGRCYLNIPDQSSIRAVYQVLLKESLAFRLLEAIFLELFDNYDLLAEKLFISKATLKRTLLALNQGLKPYEMVVGSRPVALKGNEKNIRAFYFFYFQERYPDHSLPIDATIEAMMGPLLTSFQQTFTKRKDDFAHSHRMKIQLFVSLMREKFHYSMDNHYPLPLDKQEKVIGIIKALHLDPAIQQGFPEGLTLDLYKRLFYRYLEGMYSFTLVDFEELNAKKSMNQPIFVNVQKNDSNV